MRFRGFLAAAYVFDTEREKLIAKLDELIGGDSYDDIGWDHYDTSLEIHKADNHLALTDEAQTVLFEDGFMKIYINHQDGFNTLYSFRESPPPVKGSKWKRG